MSRKPSSRLMKKRTDDLHQSDAGRPPVGGLPAYLPACVPPGLRTGIAKSKASLEEGEHSTLGILDDGESSHLGDIARRHPDLAAKGFGPGGPLIHVLDHEVDHPMGGDILPLVAPVLVDLHHAAKVVPFENPDRKSTRLNSSH